MNPLNTLYYIEMDLRLNIWKTKSNFYFNMLIQRAHSNYEKEEWLKMLQISNKSTNQEVYQVLYVILLLLIGLYLVILIYSKIH